MARMPSPSDACLQACPNCAALVDIRDEEPLAKFHCPICGTAMRASRQFNHFSIVEHLGTGGMGAVYKALDRNLNRMVALKLLRKELSADDNYIAKLEEEARITASINHPYVVKVFSFGSDHGQYYIAMELVDKGTLDDLMQLQTRIAELQVLQVGLQVASGLNAAHERGLIHRDVKPGNILFADAHTAKITDFGLALLAEQEAESRGEIWGTPYYIAPEKLNNEPEDFRSDIYSLGGTLFHAVAGRPPFEAESASLVALKHLKSRAVSLQAFAPDVSSETAYVINRMLHKDPNQRYASYGELLDHFKYAIDTLNQNAAKPRAAKQRVVVESESQVNIAGVLTLLLLILIVAGGILGFVFRDRFFGTASTKSEVAVNPQAAPPDVRLSPESLYDDARHQIVDEKYADAQEALTGLAQRRDIPHPMLDWIKVHQGMTAILGHQLSESRSVFAAMRQAGMFSTETGQRELANFFVELGRNLGDANPVPASTIKNWNANSYEDMALLLFGLKDWETGEFDSADKFFEAYLNGKPAIPYRWISDYEPIARKCVHDYKMYADLRARKNAPDADPAALRAEYTKARSELQTTGKIVEAFFAAAADLGGGNALVGLAATPAHASPPPAAPTVAENPAATPASTPVTVNAEHNAETVRWQTVRESYEQMVGLYRYDEAQAVLEHAKLTDPDFVRAHDLIEMRAKYLVAFKKTMINDITAGHGYPQSITSRRGTNFPRGLQSASADAFMAGTPYGTIRVPWTDFAPQALLAVAAYYADATPNPVQAADRRWLAATFALENGQLNEAKSLAARAAQGRAEYAKELGQFSGTVGVAAPLAPSH